MITLAELMEQVVVITNRPGQVAEMKQGILTALLKEHAAVDYQRDLVPGVNVVLPTASDYRYTISIGTELPLFRKISRIREALLGSQLVSYAGTYGSIEFQLIRADAIFDSYGTEYVNTYYIANNNIQLQAVREVSSVNISYYARPDTGFLTSVSGEIDSWIANEFGYVIQAAAAAYVFKAIGRDNEAKFQIAAALDGRRDIIMSNITEVG